MRIFKKILLTFLTFWIFTFSAASLAGAGAIVLDNLRKEQADYWIRIEGYPQFISGLKITPLNGTLEPKKTSTITFDYHGPTMGFNTAKIGLLVITDNSNKERICPYEIRVIYGPAPYDPEIKGGFRITPLDPAHCPPSVINIEYGKTEKLEWY